MEISGRIIPATGSNPFERESWIRIIKEHPELVQGKPLEGVPNPFKPGETMTVHPDPTEASLIVNGEKVGTFGWAANEEILINVSGKLSDISSYAKEYANLIGGVFVPD